MEVGGRQMLKGKYWANFRLTADLYRLVGGENVEDPDEGERGGVRGPQHQVRDYWFNLTFRHAGPATESVPLNISLGTDRV